MPSRRIGVFYSLEQTGGSMTIFTSPENPITPMFNQMLSYWKPGTADASLNRKGLLNHAASNQYGRLAVRDTVWIVTVRDGALFLLGRIIVDKITDQEGASIALRDWQLWDSNYHIIGKPRSAKRIQQIAIGHVASRLRFVSRSGNTRLKISKGRVDARQLQTMRLLTDDSAALLEDAFGGG